MTALNVLIGQGGGWSLPLLLLACSLLPAIVVFLLPIERQAPRSRVILAGAGAMLALVALLILGVYRGDAYSLDLPMGGGLRFLLHVDALALLFVTLSAVLWFATTLYAMAYLKDDPEQRRFFGFFSLCVTSTTGIALAGNLLTFFIFYEMLTLATLPLLLHKGDAASLAAGRVYLRYTLAGSAALLAGMLILEAMVGPGTFLERPQAMDALAEEGGRALSWVFLLLVGGLAVKAAMVPLHGWLPAAMVAPAPVSALLHAVAVVKAGAFGIVRIVFDVYGVEMVGGLGLDRPLIVAASLTIILGSVIALHQDEVKRRLAYSTVSQLSYIVLGAALLSPPALIGCLAHVVHQGLMKITLFFGAGALEKTLGIKRIDELDGAGRRMPLTMLAFSAGALGMIGLPPLAGFVTKWYLGLGALEAGHAWVLGVLAASTLLNAGYFLPLLYRAWFRPPRADWAETDAWEGDAAFWLIAPAVLTALASIGAGLLAATSFSPLEWARLIVLREYSP